MRRYVSSLAAMVLAVVGWLSFYPALQGVNTHQTMIGEQRTVMLQDGSVVTLNTDSKISVAMTANVRRLHLMKGEVYFAVAKDKARPFEVVVDNSYVKAVGTAFNIRKRNDQVSVLVTEGKVEFRSDFVPKNMVSATESGKGDVHLLHVGEQITTRQGVLERLTLVQAVMDKRTQWRGGEIDMDGLPLSEMVKEIQPYISEKIVIVDDGVADLVAGGVFQVGHAQSFFDALEAVLPVKIVRENNVIILTRRPEQGLSGQGFENVRYNNQYPASSEKSLTKIL